MDIKESDLKLLAYLYHHNRESLVKISKETGLTRIQVEYKLNKLKEEGFIKSFFTVFDYGAFGYRAFVIALFKLEKYSSVKEFSKKLENSKNCISMGECFGKYDLYANLIFKDEEEISSFLSEYINKKGSFIQDYKVIKPYFAELQPLKLFLDKNKPHYPLIGKSQVRSFSQNELKIMKILSNDGRARIIDIADKVAISAEMVIHTIKKLQNNNVILGIRTELNMKKLGYNYSVILLNIRNFSDNLKEEIIKFSRKESRVNTLSLSLFNPNCVIQLFHETEDELKEDIIKIKQLLKNEVFDMDVILAQEDNKINTLPFLYQ